MHGNLRVRRWLRHGTVLATLATAAFAAAQQKNVNIRKRTDTDGAAAAERKQGKSLDAEAVKELEQGAEKFNITTDDGVYLSTTYWRAKNASKNTPVVVLLHGRGQTQRDWYPFAKQLNDADFAVVTFDFRGHGESRDVDPSIYKKPKEYIESKRANKQRELTGNRVVPQGSRALKEKLAEKNKRKSGRSTAGDRIDEKDEFKTGDELVRFCVKDLEAVKRFLLDHHNSGEFNVRNLGIVTAEMGGSVATRWMSEKEFLHPTRAGWSTTGGDMHALVMVTPQWNYGGYSMSSSKPASKSNYEELEIMIVAGNDPKSADNAVRTGRLFGVPEAPAKDAKKPVATTVRGRGKNSLAVKVNSKLTGTKLFNPPVDGVDEQVIEFLKSQLSGKKIRGWEKRDIDIDTGGFGSAVSGGNKKG